jgi:hypothetical protein
MDIKEEIEFLTLLRNKVDLLIPKISIRDPLLEISAMLSSRISILEESCSGSATTT